MAAAKARFGGLRGYAVGAGCFLLALAARQISGVWVQTHFPYLTLFFGVIGTAYLAGIGPAATVAFAATAFAYFTYAPARFGVAAISSPMAGGAAFLITTMGCALVIAALRTSRDRLEDERVRYADLAENRDLLYRELQHRVSNNIQVVAGMLRLQAGNASPDVARALGDAAGRIGLIAKIQRELYSQTGAPSAFRDFAEDLLANALSAAGAEQVKIVIEGGDRPLHPDQATAVALVLLECFNNALEHAFANGRPGLITVEMTRDGAQWRLTVQDDGPGPPPGFNIDGAQSFGLKIVRAMAMQLQGGFALTDGQPGALCRLTFPALD
jgi:two-component sensor histidine kinase